MKRVGDGRIFKEDEQKEIENLSDESREKINQEKYLDVNQDVMGQEIVSHSDQFKK